MSDDTGAADKAAIDDAANQTDPILKKNQELLGEAKAAKNRARELEAKLQEYESKEAAKAEEEAKKRGEFDKLEADYKKRLDESDAKYRTTVISESLTTALKEANVAAPFFDAAKAMFKDKGISLDKDANVLIGNSTLSEAIKEWSQTDSGKAFIAAPNSTGGGASGGGATDNKSMKRAAFDALSPIDRTLAMRGGLTLTD